MEDQQYLLQQLLNKPDWDQADKQWLLEYLETTETEELKALMLEGFYAGGAQKKTADAALTLEMLDNIRQAIGVRKKPLTARKSIRVMLAAAALAIVVLLPVYFLFKAGIEHGSASRPLSRQQSAETAGDKAVLTLADGSSITLDDAANGALAQQGGTKVLKLNGKISYAAASKSNGEVLYNTITTPRGRQFEVELPDGSRVWLNAASSIRFPAAFAGSERKVEITGEAYFEIEKNTLPFIVKVKNAEVKVLGTHFNIMAYNDEAAIKTTLLEGAVRFVSAGGNQLLKPGQQSQMDNTGTVKIVSGVNIPEVMAWKNGVFHFEGEDITAIMRQLSRWYNVSFNYQGNDINDLFYADIPRNTDIKEVLKALELTGKVKFSINGRDVMVTP